MSRSNREVARSPGEGAQSRRRSTRAERRARARRAEQAALLAELERDEDDIDYAALRGSSEYSAKSAIASEREEVDVLALARMERGSLSDRGEDGTVVNDGAR